MTTRTVTMSELLDLAVNKLPRLRRGVMKLRLSNSNYREQVLAELRLKASEDTECCALMGTAFATALADVSITDSTPFTIDIDKLNQLIELIFKWLPKILDLFKMFAAIAFVVFSFGLTQSANAQMVCANGQCQLLRGAAVVATAPVRAVANVVTYPSRYAAVSSSQGYGCQGSTVQSYGSQGSQVASGGSAGSNQRWRFGDRIRANAAARQASRAASYGCAGSTVQGYGSSGTMLMMTVPACGNPACTCDPCNCAPASPTPAPAAPVPVPDPSAMRAPVIALPPETAIRELYVQSFPK